MKYLIIVLLSFYFCLGIYSQENTQTYYESEKISEDIDFLLESLNSIHPTFNQYISDNNFIVKIDSIKNAFQQPISEHDFFKAMQPVISVDGHTSLRFGGKIYPEIEAPFFPIRIFIADNQFYVKENLSSNEYVREGMIIESINGVQTSMIIDKLSKYYPHDGSLFRPYRMADDFHIYYRLVYGNFSEYCLTLNENGARETIKVPGVTLDSYKSESNPQFDFKMLDNSIAYFYVGNFRQPAFFMAYVDSIFSILQQNEVEYLIIDKRSGGGFTSLADSLLSYLTDKPYKTFKKKVVKISSANRDYVNNNASNGIIKDGYLTLEYPPIIPVRRKNMFTGNTYILMNHKTHSAATYFVSVIKCNDIATLVGEEAGQPLISNGDIHGFRLPNTEMICYSSMSTYYFPCAVNREDSVMPDYEVQPAIEDLLSNTDACLEYALELINKLK